MFSFFRKKPPTPPKPKPRPKPSFQTAITHPKPTPWPPCSAATSPSSNKTPPPAKPCAANWLGSLLDLYFHHSTHDQPENLTPAAALVRPYLQRFPEQYSGFFESYLEQAPDPAAAFATLLALGAQNRQDYCLSQMFGDGDTDSFPTATPPPSSKPPCPNAARHKSKPCNNKCWKNLN
ncbi:hypothetical protein [Neisseria bacilliformis]|uniref:hypothetical protein n=1 Tax=Neisseria bacilliformis TaxID=267212 RepID=UPI0006682AFD|nr:hypothetical protein [Neisseria bacilliformis]